MKYSKKLIEPLVFGAKYTTHVYTLAYLGYDFGLSDFPIFDENYRQKLVDKFIEHYFFYEIGVETPAWFRLNINTAFNEIMPYYNQLYNTTILKYGILEDFNTTRNTQSTSSDNTNIAATNSSASKTSGKQNSTDSQNATSKSVGSDTPQNLLLETDIANNVWATTAGLNDTSNSGENRTNSESSGEDSSTGTTSQKSDGRENLIETAFGYNSNPTANIIAFRNAIINIDMEIIEDTKIKKCFMGVY